MTLAPFVAVAASASGVFMALSPLLQARRIRAVGDSTEVSAGVFSMMRVNATIWLAYGVSSGNLVVVLPNVVAVVTTTATLIVIRRYRHGHAPAPVAASAAPEPSHPDPLVVRQQTGHMERVRGGAASLARAGRRMAPARR